MDVYTEWCGPCLAMVGSLKKIKLELGGDNLQLAICKSDTIQALERFRNKSEPTWLFASHGKIVNIMFGTNVPKLMQLIAKELEIEMAYVENRGPRTFYEAGELLPIEEERLSIIMAAENEALRIEKEEADRKRREYLKFVTDEIITNLPECGVTIFGPHVNRDIFKKVSEQAEDLGLSCRDRRVTQIVPENIEVLHFQCENPLDEDVLDYMFNKDVLICMWKMEKPDVIIEEALQTLTDNLTKPQPVYDDYGMVIPDQNIPPMIQEFEIEPAKEKSAAEAKKEESAIEAPSDELDLPEMGLQMTSLEDTEAPLEEGEEPVHEDEKAEPVPEKSKSDAVAKPSETSESAIKVIIPGVWTPSNKVTNAAAIYVYFRTQTDPFLPPDPVPDPPHLAIAFEAYKRKDVFEICEQYQDAILSYGYFSNSDPEKAKLIANSTAKYEARSQNVEDKLVLKVAKVTSHAILALSAHGPTHVSQNTVSGKKECRKFFPEGYKTGEDEALESTSQLDTGEKKKKKKKKKAEPSEVGTLVSDQEITQENLDGEGEEELGEEQLAGDDADAACEGDVCPLRAAAEDGPPQEAAGEENTAPEIAVQDAAVPPTTVSTGTAPPATTPEGATVPATPSKTSAAPSGAPEATA